MNATVILLWIINMALDTGGHIAMKAAASHGESMDGLNHWKNMAKRPWIWIGISCYVIEFFTWMAFLSQVELSVGILLGCANIVTIMLAGRCIFNEKLTFWRVSGIFLISCGVAIVGLGG